MRQVEQLRSDFKPGVFQAQMRTKNGDIRHFLWSYSGDQQTGDLYAAGYDITEIKEAQQVRDLAKKLGHQNEQLANFAHIASHNLRSHVGNLGSLLQLHKEAEPAEKAVLFEMFEKVAQHLQGTLNDLIDSLRIKEDIGKERHPVNFEAILAKTKEILASQILESNVLITDNFDIKSIEYPSAYLESIFLNLLSNAIKYRSAQRPLRVNMGTSIHHGSVSLTVEDNGEGIDMTRNGDKLFGFYKTFHARSDSKGLGLFITKTQIDAMGGTISVESEVNQGAKFTIVFSRREPPVN